MTFLVILVTAVAIAVFYGKQRAATQRTGLEQWERQQAASARLGTTHCHETRRRQAQDRGAEAYSDWSCK